MWCHVCKPRPLLPGVLQWSSPHSRRYVQIVYAHMTLKSRQIKMHDTCAPREAIAPPSAHTAAQMCPHPHTPQSRCVSFRTHLSPDMLPSAHSAAHTSFRTHLNTDVFPSAHTSVQMCSFPHTPQSRCAPFRTHRGTNSFPHTPQSRCAPLHT